MNPAINRNGARQGPPVNAALTNEVQGLRHELTLTRRALEVLFALTQGPPEPSHCNQTTDSSLADAIHDGDIALNRYQLVSRCAAVFGWQCRCREIIGDDIFDSPAWRLLMETFARTMEGKVVCSSDLAISTGLAPSTVSRHVRVLEEKRLTYRRADPVDRRRHILALSAKGAACMSQCIHSLDFIQH